jgi:hypothetical protein
MDFMTIYNLYIEKHEKKMFFCSNIDLAYTVVLFRGSEGGFIYVKKTNMYIFTRTFPSISGSYPSGSGLFCPSPDDYMHFLCPYQKTKRDIKTVLIWSILHYK